MGSEQSRTHALGADNESAQPLNYYDLLQIDKDASPEEIKVPLNTASNAYTNIG